MEKPGELVKWFFLFLDTESAMLMRIEFCVVVIALLYLLMFILDLWRLRSRSSAIKYILLVLDAVADSTFLYTIGLMQDAPFKKDLFPVWALVLVNLRFSGCFISAYGIPDQENRRNSELSTVTALAVVAVLSGTRHSQFKHPIWAMWALQVIRGLYLIYAYLQAIKSTLHGKSSAFVTVASNHADEAPTQASNHVQEAPPRASSPADEASPLTLNHADDAPPRASNHADEAPPRVSNHAEDAPPRASNHVEEAPPQASSPADEASLPTLNHADDTPPPALNHADEAPPRASNHVEEAPPRASSPAHGAPLPALNHADDAPPWASNHVDDAPPRASNHVDEAPPRASNHAEDAAPRASNHVEEAPPRASSPADEALLPASNHADEAPPRASNHADEAPPRVSNHAEDAPPRASNHVEEAPPQALSPANEAPLLTLNHVDDAPPRALNHADEAPPRASNHVEEVPPRASSPAHEASLLALNHADDAPPRATNPADEAEVDLDTMAGYDYPVFGDHRQKFEVKAPKYNFNLSTDHPKMLTTIETVWMRGGTLDNLSSRAGIDVKPTKEMCLSFSLYRLLRCRFDNFSLPDDSVRKTRKLITEIMNKWGSERTFRIVESELAFINDYFYTRYPVLFYEGFPRHGTWHPVATIAFTFWLGRDIHRSYKPRPGETAHVIHGVNVDLIITWVFMGAVVLKECWKMLTYLLSDWTKVTVLCHCIANNSEWLLEKLFWLITPRLKIVQRWHRKIDQYEFIQSYAYNPWMKNLLFYLSLGILPKNAKGVILGEAIKVPKEVEAAILKSILSMDLKERFLKGDDIPSLKKAHMDIRSEIQWAFKLNTCTHTILVWHIATSMCEIELAQHCNTNLTESEVLRSSQPYIIKLQRLERAIRANFSVASSLSRYCAYMITKVPDLLPDSSFVADFILQSTIEEASKILDGCDNLQSIYRRLMGEEERKGNTVDDPLADDAEEQSRCCYLSGASCFVIDVGEDEDHNPRDDDGDDMDDVVPQERIITRGARLGRSLVKIIGDDVSRWEFLSEVWADLLVHMAPSWNTDAHKKYLATGGEFITHVWAILSHCNIESSKLWPEEIPADDDGTDGQQPGATGGDQGVPQ